MDSAVEKDCSVLELLFHQIITDMKNNVAIWEDFSSKGNRLHMALKTAMVCLNAFLESFQRVADMASGTKGATKDVGSALTRLCLRHRSIEGKMKLFTNSVMESMVIPMMEKMEDWKKTLVVMDREHTRENKRGHQEIKKSFSEAQKEHKKMKKSGAGKQEEVEKLYKSANEKLLQLRENEMNAVRGALIEERHRLCLFVACLKPVMDEELSLLSEITHLQEIVENLCMLADDPDSLPATGEQVICDTIGRGLSTSTSQISSDQTTLVKGHLPPSSNDHQQHQQQQQQRQEQQPQAVQQQTSSRQHSMESPSSELSAESSVSDSFSSSATSPSKTARVLAQISEKSSRDSTEKHGGARIVSIESKPSHQDLARGHPLVCSLPDASSAPLSSSSSPHNFPQLLTHHRNPSLTSSGTREIRYLDPSSLIGCRPHTISYVRDRSCARSSLLAAETYEAFGGVSGHADGSPYAVPCVVPPKRRSTGVGSEKVADIYARPSLAQSHGGYRTPNIKPLPVATPTVPDGSGNIPGYPNANLSTEVALHQTNPVVRRETVNRDSMPDIESLRFSQSCRRHQVDQLQQSTSMLIGCEGRLTGRDHRRQISLDAGQIAKLSEPCSGTDLKSLALRIARACHFGTSKRSNSLRVARKSPIPERSFREPPSAVLLLNRNSLKFGRVGFPITDVKDGIPFCAKLGTNFPKASGHKTDGSTPRASRGTEKSKV